MAVRVQTSAVENFGTFADETTVTHAMARVGAAVLTTRPLVAARTVAAGGQAEFAAGEIDLVFPKGQLEDAGLSALLALAFDGAHAVTIDLMTSSNAVVTTAGYVAQAVTGWSRSTESD